MKTNSISTHPALTFVRNCSPQTSIASIALAVTLLFAPSAFAAAALTEPFDYNVTDGSDLGSNGSWLKSGGGAGADVSIDIKDGDLSLPAIQDPSVTYNKRVRLTQANGLGVKSFTNGTGGVAITSGSYYVSFLFKTVTPNANAGYYAPVVALGDVNNPSFSSATGSRQMRAGVVVYCKVATASSTVQLGVRKGASSATTGTTAYATNIFTTSDTVFVVAKYTFGAGAGDDTVTLWVNPASVGGSEDGSPSVAASTTANANDIANLQFLSIVSGSSGNGGSVNDVDNLRVGATWADVTPAGGPCVAPAITNQPVAATACQGDTAVFTVGATGTALIYQWQKNGVPIANGPTGNGSTNSGVTTATLTVSSIAAADAALAAAGYDCIITNGCGTTNSTRVALSVNTAPAPFAVTGGGSYCTGGGGVAVGLAGSESGVSYYLRLNGANNGVTTNGTGAALSFGNQTTAGTYTVIATNGTGCSALMTTNAVVAINSQPGITTEPVAATTAVGGSATFTVVATGGSLTYQWNKNGVTISTATNASYTLYPAALGDAALAANGYDCTITGPCGSTNSVRVALTVNAASDLIWAGDGSANLWNTLGAANWSNGVSLVQFTSGDRVSCDDSSANPVVNISGTQVPTSVTVNSASNYVFASGGVGGALATVTKAGTGSLTIIGAQSYGGGTVISNGTLAISNNASLGTGAATLAGGNLTTLRTLTLANGLNATASGVLTYNGTGDSSLVLNGTFNVAGGTTLTITHTAGGPDRLRVFDTNTTVNGDIVLNGAGIAFACYSASGTQTFNGIISGNGQVMRRTANAGVFGTTIFNGNNTYSGNTTLTDGVIGFGLSSTGDPVTAGPIGTGTLAFVDSTSSPSVRTLFASGGARTVGNPVTIGGAQTNRINGANDLTLAGTINLGAATRTFEINNSAKTIFANVVSNGGLTKNGAGTLYLNATNTYTGPTTVNAGTLGGTGVLVSAVTVGAGGNLAPGASIGTLTITNDLVLTGTFTAEVDNTASPNCDRVIGISNVVYGGTLAIVNNGPALAASDTFAIFSATNYGGAFTNITPATPGAGLVWNTNTLTTDGTLRITSTGGASSDANLAALVVTPAGTLSPAFDSNTVAYAATEAYANSPITVTPTSSDVGAVIQVIYGGATNVVTSGNPSGPLALDANPSVPNVAQVRVTAADTTTVKNYTVTVTRQPSVTPPTLTKVSSGGNLTMSWPLDHTGWTLQTQTNSRSVGLVPATWFDVAGSTVTNQVVLPISSTNQAFFFRLKY